MTYVKWVSGKPMAHSFNDAALCGHTYKNRIISLYYFVFKYVSQNVYPGGYFNFEAIYR